MSRNRDCIEENFHSSKKKILIIQLKSKHFVNFCFCFFGRYMTHFMCLYCVRREPSLQKTQLTEA